MRRASNENSVSIGSRTIRRNFPSLLLGLFALMLGACTTSGMGGGELSRPGKPDESVLYSWKSNDGVVFLVLMGVDRVVADRPQDAADEQQIRRQAQIAVDRRPAHQRAPVEGDPQLRLRPVRRGGRRL